MFPYREVKVRMSRGETLSSLLSTLTRRKLPVETLALSLEKVRTAIYVICRITALAAATEWYMYLHLHCVYSLLLSSPFPPIFMFLFLFAFLHFPPLLFFLPLSLPLLLSLNYFTYLHLSSLSHSYFLLSPSSPLLSSPRSLQVNSIRWNR